MGEFKIGDRVRWTRVPTQFQNAIVFQVGCWPFDYQIAEDGETSYAYEHELERFTDARDTTIRKGDKFRVNVDDEAGAYSNGDIFVAIDADDLVVDFYDNDGDLRFISHSRVALVDDHGEPWDYDPRGKLQIQEGKYYRTRDEQKVGPMERFDGQGLSGDSRGRKAAFHAEDMHKAGIGGSYADDGAWLTSDGKDDNDLIAEWREPSKGCAAAEVDNLRDEYGPVVEPVKKSDSDLVISVSSDFSSLHADIDRAKAHLLDLESHAARLGIKLGFDVKDVA